MSNFNYLYVLAGEDNSLSVRSLRDEIGEGTWVSYEQICLDLINEGWRGIETVRYGKRGALDFHMEAEAMHELMRRHPAKSKKANKVREVLDIANQLKADSRKKDLVNRFSTTYSLFMEIVEEIENTKEEL